MGNGITSGIARFCVYIIFLLFSLNNYNKIKKNTPNLCYFPRIENLKVVLG